MNQIKNFVGKNWMLLNVMLLMFFVTVGSAFATAPAVPGVQDILTLPFGTMFAEVGSLVVVLNLVGAGIRHLFKAEGPVLFSSIVVAGIVLGIVGQYTNLLTVADYVNTPAPWGGVAFGFAAGLQAVGVNQGKRQFAGKTPVNKPNKKLPTSG